MSLTGRPFVIDRHMMYVSARCCFPSAPVTVLVGRNPPAAVTVCPFAEPATVQVDLQAVSPI